MGIKEKTAFEVYRSNRRTNDMANQTGRFYNSSNEPEICFAGAMCVQGARTISAGYEQHNIANKSAFKMTLAIDGFNDSPIFAMNMFGVNEITDPTNGNTYRIGADTLGIPLPANTDGTFTMIEANMDYAVGLGNFVVDPGFVDGTTLKTFAIIKNGLLQTQATKADTGLYFEVFADDSTNFTNGVYNGGKKFIITARKAA